MSTKPTQETGPGLNITKKNIVLPEKYNMSLIEAEYTRRREAHHV